jgi:hypothetical protein
MADEAAEDKDAKDNDKDKPRTWWETKLGLLVIGSVISGLLVPWLQYTQKSVEWKRQNQFQNTQHRLEQMRECLTNFALLWAYVGEGYERARPLLLDTAVGKDAQQKFEQQFIELQNQRFRQNAKVVSLFIYFDEAEELRNRFQEFLVQSAQYFRDLESVVRARTEAKAGAAGAKSNGAASVDLDNELVQLDRLYSAIVDALKEQIQKVQDASEKFGL